MNPGSTRYWHHWASQSSGQRSVGLAWHYRHGTAVGTLFTLNCMERLSDVLLKLWSGVYWPTAVQCSPCFVKPQLQAQDKRSVSFFPAHTKFTSVCPTTLLISLPHVNIPFSMVVSGVGLVRGSVWRVRPSISTCLQLYSPEHSWPVACILMDFPVIAVCLVLLKEEHARWCNIRSLRWGSRAQFDWIAYSTHFDLQKENSNSGLRWFKNYIRL
jgi:hypothetical protein